MILIIILFLTSWVSSNLAAQSFPRIKCTIIDTAGREIVPCNFRSVSYVGSGLFLLREVTDTNSVQPSASGHVVNEHGKELQVQVPKNTFLTNLFLPKSADGKAAWAGTSPPAGSIVEIYSSQGYGLADLEGNILLEPEFQQIGREKIGLFSVYKDGKVAFAFDALSRKRFSEAGTLALFDYGTVADGKIFANRMLFIDRSGQTPLWGYFDSAGRVAIKPQFEGATSFDQDGFARVWSAYADLKRRRCYLIDQHGHRISSPEYENIFGFHHGLAVVRIRTKDGTLRYGIIDKKFNYVLQPNWMRLEFLSGENYLAQRNSGDQLTCIKADGSGLFEFPPETFAAKESDGLILCYQGSNSDENRFVKERKNISLLTSDGKTVFSARNCQEIAFANGTAVLAQDVVGQSKIEKSCTIITKSGITASGIKAWYVNPVGSDRLIKSTIDPSFSPVVWKREVNSRNEQFANFLRSYDLIGMPRSQVEALLGKPDFGNCYRNYAGMCGSVGGWIEFEYAADRVTGWRWASQTYRENTYKPWVTTNVIYDYIPFPRIGEDRIQELIPKRSP